MTKEEIIKRLEEVLDNPDIDIYSEVYAILQDLKKQSNGN